MEMIELTINGKKISVPPKTTILQAAQQNGIYIPHMCYDRRLKPYGGCRLCLVEVEKVPKLLAACSTPAGKDMVIYTESEKLSKARSTVLELMMVHHPLDCPVCDKAGECELQDLAYKYGPSKPRFKGERKHGPEILAAPLLERNPNRCILCGKCVRVCTEHQGVGAINLIGRGFETIVSPAFEETLDCEFCGQCIDACPVGALGSKPYRYRSRVWYMEEKDSICPYCGCGCTITLGLREGRVIRSVGRDGRGISKGDLCGKGRFGFDFLYSERRIKTPMIRHGADLKLVSWVEALDYVASKMKEIITKHGAKSVGAVGSQRASVEDNYMLQKFFREGLGSNNVDSTARFGYARVHDAVKQAFGMDVLPVKFDSPLDRDAILVVESDITSTHPVIGLQSLAAARDFNATLTVIDPKMTKLARHSDEWLRNRPGTAIAVLNGMMKTIIDEGLVAESAGQVAGFGDLKAALEGYSLEEAERLSGVSASRIADAARAFAKAEKRMAVMTLGQNENNKSTATVLAVANLLMLVGSGPESLQIPAGLSNTLGMYEAGVRPDAGPGGEAIKGEPGLTLEQMFYGAESPIKAMFIMGANPMVALPRISEVEARIKGLELLVFQGITMNDTAKLAHVVLPASAWAEKDGTLVGATGIAQNSEAVVPALEQTRPDWEILSELSARFKPELKVKSLDALRQEIGRKVKFQYSTQAVKPKFNPVVDKTGEETDEEYPLNMVIGILMQHSGSLTALSKHLGSVVADAYMLISDEDAKKYKVKSEDFVRVASRRGEVILKARITDEVPAGMLFVPAHFAHAKVNALTYPAANGSSALVAVKLNSV